MRSAAVDCGHARRLAWGPAEDPVLPVERGLALAHLANCDACRRFQADMARMRTVGASVPPATVSPRFATRVATACGEARGGMSGAGGGGWRRWLVAAGAVLVAAGAIRLGHARDGVSGPRFTDAIAASQPILLNAPGIDTGDAVVVQRWIADRTRLPVHVPTLPGVRLRGATVRWLQGVPVAVVRFQVGQDAVTYTVAPAVDSLAAAPGSARALPGNRQLVAWQDGAREHVWVGAVPAPTLELLARQCAAQARAAMHESGSTRGRPARRSHNSHLQEMTT